MREERTYFVYILASSKNGTLYIGIANDLQRRVSEHRGVIFAPPSVIPVKTGIQNKKNFTQKYGVNKLVYFEEFGEVDEAIQREKRLKKWNRAWKIELIEKENPGWTDLYPKLFEE
ncbi:GIY-YIG nuclease family protein [Patescibacteria group bacterium]|nr:GIY-YIG nuclease family protein [Patescibacteria group bacterium]